MKYLDRVTNIAVLLAVVVFIFSVGRDQFGRRSTRSTTANDFIGKTIRLPGVQFPQGHDSLLLAISTTCHFCQESLPFYKELATRANGQVDVVAVLPQPQAEAEKFLEGASVHTTQVISAELNTLGVAATPTVLLVDSGGKVRNAWIGLLNEKQQHEVLSRVLPGPNSALNVPPRATMADHTSKEDL